MSIRRGLVIAGTAGALALLAPSAAFATSASPHQAAAAPSDISADPPDVLVTDPATGCTEYWHVHITYSHPLVGFWGWTEDAHWTSNPCSLHTGLEAMMEVTNSQLGTSDVSGNDVYKVGVVSGQQVSVIVGMTNNQCDKFGARWWNGSKWVYKWFTSSNASCP